MIWLLKMFIFGHVHKWKEIERVRLRDEDGCTGTRIYTVCEGCGEHRKWDSI